MCLIVPARDLKSAKPLRLKMTGSASSSKSWFALQAYLDTISYYKERYIKLSEDAIYRVNINKKVFKEDKKDEIISLQLELVPSCTADKPIERKLSFQTVMQQNGRTNSIIGKSELVMSVAKTNFSMSIGSTKELALGKHTLAIRVFDETNSLLTEITEEIKNLVPLYDDLKDIPRLFTDINPPETERIEAEDSTRVQRKGRWREGLAARSTPVYVVQSRDNTAQLQVDFAGCAFTIIFPGNWQMPGPQYRIARQGKIDVLMDGIFTNEIDLLTAPEEVMIANDLKPGPHQVLVKIGQNDQTFVSIDAFRVGNFPFGSMEFDVFGDDSYNLNDVRVEVKKDNKVILCKPDRNAFTGRCLVTGLKPGSYDLRIWAMGWKAIEKKNINISAVGQTIHLGSFYLEREERAQGSRYGILSPNRGQTIFVQPGDTFDIHCAGGADTRVQAACLVTDYLKIPLKIVDAEVSRYYYENTIKVKLPESLPLDFYDLAVKFTYQDSTRGWESLAPQSVQVYQGFPCEYYLVTFGHTDTWGQQASEWLRELAGMINLINPQFVLISTEVNWAYISGALASLRIPYFVTTGNHSYPNYEDYYGPRVSIFDMGGIRGVNFGLPWSSDWIQVKAAFQDRPKSSIRIINCYEANAPVETLLDAYRINLIHDAHGTGSKNIDLGHTPTRRIGKTIPDAFRLVRMKGPNVVSATYENSFEAPIPFPRSGVLPLGIKFSSPNDGTSNSLTATIMNTYNEIFENGKIRFCYGAGHIRRPRRKDNSGV